MPVHFSPMNSISPESHDWQSPPKLGCHLDPFGCYAPLRNGPPRSLNGDFIGSVSFNSRQRFISQGPPCCVVFAHIGISAILAVFFIPFDARY